MSDFTNRVYLPTGDRIYVSDDGFGDMRLVEFYKRFGDLKVEICQKEFGSSLHDAKVLVTTTLKDLIAGVA